MMPHCSLVPISSLLRIANAHRSRIKQDASLYNFLAQRLWLSKSSSILSPHPTTMARRAAYVTLLTKDQYLAGTLVLEYSLQAVRSKYPLVVMFTPQLSQEATNALIKANIATVAVDVLSPAEGT